MGEGSASGNASHIYLFKETSMLKKILASVCLLLLPAAADAALPDIASPSKAVLSPSRATLYVNDFITVEDIDGVRCIRILLPSGAQDFQLSLADGQVLRTTGSIVTGGTKGALNEERARLEREITELEGKVLSIKAKMEFASQDPVKNADIDIADLYVKQEQFSKRIKTLKELLKNYPEAVDRYLMVTAALAGDAKDKVSAFYSYSVQDCTWYPAYQINCVPQPDGKGVISVRLEAVVDQGTCFNWNGTEIVLATTGTGAVRQPDLRIWNIGQERAQVRNREVLEGAGAPAMMMAAPVEKRASRPAKAAVADISGTFASWTPLMKGLPQGESRILLAAEEWKENLVWKVRPLDRDARVFLCASHDLEKDKVWPRGKISLSLDGAVIGTDDFAPREGKILLSFGSDPRVQLTAVTEPRKSGTQGFIGKDKIWEWAWKYTVRNDRENAVHVEVERPLPKSVNKDVVVEYTSDPPAKAGSRSLTWTLDIPSHQSRVVSHGVKVTAPEKLSIITPVAP